MKDLVEIRNGKVVVVASGWCVRWALIKFAQTVYFYPLKWNCAAYYHNPGYAQFKWNYFKMKRI